jgi:flagellar biosynthesis chaperone FliJ
MKNFVWRLQRVFDIKKKEKQKKQSELLAITEKLAKARGELLIRKKILENIIDSLAKENPMRRLEKQEFFLKCSTTNDEVIRKLETKVNELEIQQREKKAEVLKLKRFNKSLEKLRAEAKTQFIKEQDRLEQKEADEMTIIRFAGKIISQECAVNC